MRSGAVQVAASLTEQAMQSGEVLHEMTGFAVLMVHHPALVRVPDDRGQDDVSGTLSLRFPPFPVQETDLHVRADFPAALPFGQVRDSSAVVVEVGDLRAGEVVDCVTPGHRRVVSTLRVSPAIVIANAASCSGFPELGIVIDTPPPDMFCNA